jgi:hypothetical protein
VAQNESVIHINICIFRIYLNKRLKLPMLMYLAGTVFPNLFRHTLQLRCENDCSFLHIYVFGKLLAGE